MASTLDLDEVAAHLRSFAAARDWEQFHTPKNLTMALAGEVAAACRPVMSQSGVIGVEAMGPGARIGFRSGSEAEPLLVQSASRRRMVAGPI